jgi:hypothetical protein
MDVQFECAPFDRKEQDANYFLQTAKTYRAKAHSAESTLLVSAYEAIAREFELRAKKIKAVIPVIPPAAH